MKVTQPIWGCQQDGPRRDGERCQGTVSYRITKNGRLFVYWHGQHAKREIALEGPRAEKLIRELPAMAPNNDN